MIKQQLAAFSAIQSKPVSQRELLEARNALETGFVPDQDSLFCQALLLGPCDLLSGL